MAAKIVSLVTASGARGRFAYAFTTSPASPSKSKVNNSFISSSTPPSNTFSGSSYSSDVARTRRFLHNSSITGASVTGMTASSAGASGTGTGMEASVTGLGASVTASKNDIWRGCVESSGFGFAWMAGFSFLFKSDFRWAAWIAHIPARCVCVCAQA